MKNLIAFLSVALLFASCESGEQVLTGGSILVIIGIIEAIARVLPTGKTFSIINIILKMVVAVLKQLDNIKKSEEEKGRILELMEGGMSKRKAKKLAEVEFEKE